MKFNIRAQKIEITDAIRDYAEKKVAKLEKYFDKPDELTVNVVIKPKGLEQKAEVTIMFRKFTLRAEDSNKDLYAAFDLVTDKLERQIRKNKTRMKSNKDSIKMFNLNFETKKEEENNTNIVRRKNVESKPMDEEEAILQMELSDHDFYVFKNVKTGLTNIIYKRDDGNYGLMEIN